MMVKAIDIRWVPAALHLSAYHGFKKAGSREMAASQLRAYLRERKKVNSG